MVGFKGSGGHGFPTSIKTFVTTIIHYNVNNVLTATPQINFLSEGDGYNIQLSNDEGSTWENCTNNVKHVFSSTGQKLMLRIRASNSVIGSELQSDRKTYVPGIRVDYTTS